MPDPDTYGHTTQDNQQMNTDETTEIETVEAEPTKPRRKRQYSRVNRPRRYPNAITVRVSNRTLDAIAALAEQAGRTVREMSRDILEGATEGASNG